MSKEVADEYLSSLADLTVNSKPLINMLTMLADENVDHAPAIVQVIESHIQKVSPEVKLPILYLIDSIIKNVPRVYVPLFTQNIVNIFVSVFEKVDEKTRLNMYKLRQTWNDVFPPRKLYALDLRVKGIDNAWPVTALPPTSIHLNPKFLQGNKTVIPEVTTAVTTPQVTAPTTSSPVTPVTSESELKEQLLKKQAILIELQKKKLELELLQAKAKLEEQQQKQLKEQNAGELLFNLATRPAITEEAVKLLAQKALLKPKAVVMPPSSDSVKPTALSNATGSHFKTKIAPANTQIIEAVKSRDPRIARQQQPQTSSQPPVQQSKGPVDASYKEQEILARQLAMLKTPFVDQVAPVAPVQRVLSESNAKSHITINVERNRDRIDTKTNKKQSKDNSKSDSSRNRLKPSSPRDSSKTSPNKSSKSTPPSRDTKISPPKRSQKRNSSPERPRTPTKNLACPIPRKLERSRKLVDSYKSPKKSLKSSFSPKRGRSYVKNEKSSSKSEIIDLDDKNEKSKNKNKSSPSRVVNKERSKSPPKEKTENSENIPEVKQTESPKKDKKKDKKSENSDKVKKLDNSYLELIESSPSPEPPPPPIISRTGDDSFSDKKEDASFEDDSEDDKRKKKEVTGFKDIKGMKGRNYIRRNREPSTSPQKEATGDVDHRVNGPPEKQPRLIIQEENVSDIEKSLVNVSGKDVDLRLMVGSGSPSKKRLSTDTPGEEPPKKKNKSEVFDELFGNEDVDLRQMPTANLNPSELLPSPPPPPVISNGPQIPQVAAIAPLVVESSKLSPKPEEAQQVDSQDNGENSRESFDGTLGRYRRPRGDLKNKPEAEIKPMSLSSQLELELQPKRDSNSSYETPEKDRRKHFNERGSPRGELDRLGRPLLYNKLPNDPRARRESLVDSRDTDMRRFTGLIDRDNDTDTNIKVNLIIAQAQDQLRNKSISLPEFDEIIAQVIRVNEVQKIKEAQNKSRQESRRLHYRGRRSPPNRFGSRNSPPFRHDDDRRDRRPFNDIDERLPVAWRSGLRNEGASGYNRMGYPPGSNRSAYDVSGVDRNFEDRPIKSEIWEDERLRFRRTQQIDDHETSEKRSRDLICNERTHDCVDVPMADYKTLELIAKDPMKSINIDGTPRDIRFYGDTAVVMLSWDDPKEISFEDGLRRVAIGDQNFTCALNHPYTVIMVNGNPHRIRLGAPTRELYIDGEFYEVHFGGPPVPIQLDGIQYLVQLEGPPPQVKIGDKRTDLICGKVNLIVDATVMLPLYLDAKPQRFDLRNRPYVFRFVNSLKTLLVNEVPVDIQFGGGYRQISGYGNLHFLRLSMLPSGVQPGAVKILNMDTLGPTAATLETPTIPGTDSPVSTMQQLPTTSDVSTESKVFDNSQQQQGRSGPLDILTSLISGSTPTEQTVGFNYQIESKPAQPAIIPAVTEVPAVQPQPAGIPFLGANLNINDLFQRLVATGIVSTAANASTAQQPQGEAPLKPVDFSDPNSLKERQAGIINMLYSGIQCSSCGVRFAPEETVKYSRHLDWHFRQNRREKDAARKGQSRKWYYDVSDWIQFEEIEDLEERAQSWFETESASHVDEAAEQEEIKSVPAPPGDENVLCELCRDRFDTFYNEEKEEWHLKPCVLVEEKYYHPFCYEDLINMPEESFVDKTTDSITSVKEETLMDESKPDEELDVKAEVKTEEEAETANVEAKNEIIEEEKEREQEKEEAKEEEREKEEAKEEEGEKEEAKEEEREKEEAKEEEILVLENVKVEQQKNIISVDLSEKLDDEDDIVYQRKTPSPIVLDPAVKIKQEPVDEMESPVAVVDQTYTNVVSSIDGNVEMIEAPQVAPAAPSKIKITFNKPITTEISEKKIEKTDSNDAVEVSQEEEDPEPLPLKPKKSRIAERDLQICLPVVKGTEVSGLCSIM